MSDEFNQNDIPQAGASRARARPRVKPVPTVFQQIQRALLVARNKVRARRRRQEHFRKGAAGGRK